MDSMIEMARVWSTPFPSIKMRRDSISTDIMKRVMEKITMPMDTIIKKQGTMTRDRLVSRTLSETPGRASRVS